MENIDVRNSVFFGGMALATIVGTPLVIIYHGLSWVAVALFVGMLVLTLMSITGGYHRLFSHRAYKAKTWIKLFYLCFGAASFQESCLRWAAEHRQHHKDVDTDKDPYNIKRGFFWAHIGWILSEEDPGAKEPQDLLDDKLVMWQYRNWRLLGMIFGFGLPLAIGALFGDALGGLFFGGIVRLTVGHHFTFFINSLAHTVGTQTFSRDSTAGDSWWLAYLTFGEGFHNYHHRYPTDYRNGIRFYDWDPSKWFIKAMSWFGQTWGLKKTPEEIILRGRVTSEHDWLSRLNNQEVMQQAQELYQNLLEKIDELSERKRAWLEAKRNKNREDMEHLRQRVLEARRHYFEVYQEWSQLLNQASPQLA